MSETNFIYTFPYRAISCEIKIFVAYRLGLPTVPDSPEQSRNWTAASRVPGRVDFSQVNVLLLFYEQRAVDPQSVQPAGDQMANTVGVHEQLVQLYNVVSYTDGISAYSVVCNVDLEASGNIVAVTPFLCNDDVMHVA